MVGWHDQLNGHEFGQAPGDGEGQGSLACCSPWGRKESDMTEQLNNNNTDHLAHRIVHGPQRVIKKYLLNEWLSFKFKSCIHSLYHHLRSAYCVPE